MVLWNESEFEDVGLMVFNVAPNILINSNIYLSQIVTRGRGYGVSLLWLQIFWFHFIWIIILFIYIKKWNECIWDKTSIRFVREGKSPLFVNDLPTFVVYVFCFGTQLTSGSATTSTLFLTVTPSIPYLLP